MTGQQPPPPNPALQQPSWEEVVQIMRDDMARTFRVDVETDSMVASTIESDMQALGEVLAGLTQFWQGVAPMIRPEFCRSMPSRLFPCRLRVVRAWAWRLKMLWTTCRRLLLRSLILWNRRSWKWKRKN